MVCTLKFTMFFCVNIKVYTVLLCAHYGLNRSSVYTFKVKLFFCVHIKVYTALLCAH